MDLDFQLIGIRLNAIDFDHPFTLTAEGTIGDAPGVYAPEVTNDPDEDVTVSEGWDVLTGMTGQYSYHGAVMHASEFIGSQIARHLTELAAEQPQTFAVVEVRDDGGEYPDEPIGWAIAQLKVT
jgi:hypothetical protein